jgi:FAD/FMN-containing dehydrogenase
MVLAERRGSSAIVGDAALARFRETLQGELILSNHPDYETARRVLNYREDRYPAAIVRVADARDTVEAIRFARAHDLPIAVRSGGHDVGGRSTLDDGMIIDLSLRKGVQVNPERRVARVGAGLRAGEYIRALEPFGLVSPVGDASTTGLAGLTLGGGYGWLSGKHGLAIDNLHAVEVVTADGRILRASDEEHVDLFWAIRGGSGNFGVVTTMEFNLHRLGQVLGGMAIFPFERATEVMRMYRELTASAPDELTTYAAMATMPDGMSIAAILLCYSGDDLVEGERVIAPVRKLGPVADMIAPMPYAQMITLADNFVAHGAARDERWNTLYDLSDATIDELIDLADPSRSLGNALVIKELNGQALRVAPEATAFPHRNAPYSVVAAAQWFDRSQDAAHAAWAESVIEATRRDMSGFYVNGTESASVHEIYAGNYPRLRRTKAAYDPDNIFNRNNNITPARK